MFPGLHAQIDESVLLSSRSPDGQITHVRFRCSGEMRDVQSCWQQVYGFISIFTVTPTEHATDWKQHPVGFVASPSSPFRLQRPPPITSRPRICFTRTAATVPVRSSADAGRISDGWNAWPQRPAWFFDVSAEIPPPSPKPPGACGAEDSPAPPKLRIIAYLHILVLLPLQWLLLLLLL